MMPNRTLKVTLTGLFIATKKPVVTTKWVHDMQLACMVWMQ